MKRKFLETYLAQGTGLSMQTNKLVRYIIDNRSAMIPTAELMDMAKSVRMILKTPMAEFFDRIVATGGLNNFTAFYLVGTDASVPEFIGTTNLTLDLKQMDYTNLLRSVPELHDKIFIDMSPILKVDRLAHRLVVNSVDMMLNLYTRGYLVASYEDNDGWLSPSLGGYVAQTYSMILGSSISKYYNLSVPETMHVMAILALFMTQMLDGSDGDPMYPTLYNRCTFAGNRNDLTYIAKQCEETSRDGLTLASTCQLIAESGPEKLKNFNIMKLMALAGTLGGDIIVTEIALDYPPYWVYLLALALSGQKIPLIYQLNMQRLMTDGKTKFLQQLLADEKVFNVARR